MLEKDPASLMELTSFPKELRRFAEFLTQRDLKFEDIRVNTSETETTQVISFKHHQKLPADLPPGYAFVGGAARNVVLAEFGDAVMSPRDIDVVSIAEWFPDLSLKDELSRKIMPDDYKYGYGVREEDLNTLFSNRDFTINQVVVGGDRVYITGEALNDLKDKVVRPSFYERDRWRLSSQDAFEDYDDDPSGYAGAEESTSKTNLYGVRPRLVMKAVRLWAEYKEMYNEGEIGNIEEWQWNFENIPLFDMALGLNKAYQLGDAVSARFYWWLVQQGTVTPETMGKDCRELALNIRCRMKYEGRTPFDFDNKDLNQDPKQNEPRLEEYVDSNEFYSALTSLAQIRGGLAGELSFD